MHLRDSVDFLVGAFCEYINYLITDKEQLVPIAILGKSAKLSQFTNLPAFCLTIKFSPFERPRYCAK